MTAKSRAAIAAEITATFKTNKTGTITGAVLGSTLTDVNDSIPIPYGVWSSATAYVVNDLVTFGGSTYIAIAASTNSQPPSASWQVFASKGDLGDVTPAATAAAASATTSASAAATSASNAAASASSASTSATSASTAASNASASATTAAGSATSAATSAGAALANAKIFANTTTGIAGTTSGQYFAVAQAGANANLFDLYLNSSGTAVYQNSYPSSGTISALSISAQGSQASGRSLDTMVGSVPVVSNFTDSVAPAYTLTDVPGGKQITVSTSFKSVVFDFGRTFAGSHVRIQHTAVMSSGGDGVGIVFGQTPNRIAYLYLANGWLRTITEAGSVNNIATNWPAYSVPGTVVFGIDLTPDGNGTLTFDAGGGQRTLPVIGLPFGHLGLLLQSAQTSTHSTVYETLPVMVQEAIAGSLEISSADRDALNFSALMMQVFARQPPTGFLSSLPSVPGPNGALTVPRFYKLSGIRRFSSNINLRPLLTNPALTYYVDGVTGNDANPGTAASPFKSIKTAIVASNFPVVASKKIYVKPGVYDVATGWFNEYVGSTATITDLVPWGDGDVIVSPHYSNLAWTLVSGTMYSTTIGGLGLFDVWDAANLNPDGDYLPLTAVASQSACSSTPNSRYLTGATLYVNLANGRAPDANVLAHAAVDCGAHKSSGTTLYMERIKFRGGSNSFAIAPADNPATVLARSCEFSYSNGDSLGVAGNAFVVLQDCLSTSSMRDGFSYSPFTATSPVAFEINCIGRWNGRDGGIVNQGSTAHGSSVVVRVNGQYHHSGGGNVVEVGHTQSWNMGCDCWGSRASTLYDWCAGAGVTGDTTQMWLDTCSSASSVTWAALSDPPASATVHTFDFVATAPTGGTIVPYQA